MKLRERDIQKQICDWLTLHRIFWYRNNTGAMFGSHKGRRWAVRFGVKGAPDIVCVIAGRYVGIEVKAPEKDVSEAQMDFCNSLQNAGGFYFLVHSLEEITRPITEMSRRLR